MKKLLLLLSIIFIISMSVVSVFAEDSDKITVNMYDKEIKFRIDPMIENGRTLVPFREIFEALGCVVNYWSDNGKISVSAHRGDNFLTLEIGKNSMIFDDNTISLDTPAKILNGVTLVPLRAVSESFDTQVLWSEETKSISLIPAGGEHKIMPVLQNTTVKNESGADLINITCSYPLIENPDNLESLSKINEGFKSDAEQFISSAHNSKEDAEDFYKYKNGEDFTPYEYSLTYTVNTDKNGIISITSHIYTYTGGAHGLMLKESKNFNLNTEKDIALNDILKGSDTEIYQLIYSLFIDYFNDMKENDNGGWDLEEWNESLKNEIKNVKYYIKDNSVIFYFDPYQVAPYAFGSPSVELPYDPELFTLNLL